MKNIEIEQKYKISESIYQNIINYINKEKIEVKENNQYDIYFNS